LAKKKRKATESKVPSFTFKQHDSLGAEDAYHDQQFLEECFVETEHYKVLRDVENRRSIVVGRTGAGKTALLLRLKKDMEKAFAIPPEHLSLNFISNSTIIRFLQANGVRLDNFFRLLWRHVFAVEIIRNRFNLQSEDGQSTWFEQIQNQFRNRKHRNAIEYFRQRGGSFWQETDFRVREIVSNFEDEVSGEIGLSSDQLTAKLKGGKKFSEQERIDVTHRSQQIIDSVHMRELSDIIDTVDHILPDKMRPYYILVDRLDENWADDNLRYLLIRALIETVRDFTNVSNLKVVVAIRYDLLERVFQRTRDPGFQEEKYRSLFLDLSWTPQQLTEIMNKRLNLLVSFRYGPSNLSVKDILPVLPGPRHKPTMDYMLERTQLRPRDIIVFFNFCIGEAIGKEKITLQNLKTAEGLYSRDRLVSLQYEWQAEFPHLRHTANKLFSNSPYRFIIDEIDSVATQDLALDFVIDEASKEDPIVSSSYSLVDGRVSVIDLKLFLANIFYSVGFLGLKRTTAESFKYISSVGQRMLTKSEITKETDAEIHPCYWRALGVHERYDEMKLPGFRG